MSAGEKDEAQERPEDEAEDAEAHASGGDDEPRADDAGDAADDSGESSDGAQKIDVSDTTAPSIGPDTVIEKEDPEERLARHDQSDVDAMGLDKRRPVIGGQHGPSFARQATLYGIFLAVVAALVIGGFLLVDSLDQPPADNRDVAPWTGNDVPAKPLQ